MNGISAAAIICGIVLGTGLWLLFVRLPFMRPLTFVERIEPQLKSQNLESRLLRAGGQNATPFGPLERIIRPLLHDGLAALGKLNLGSKALTRRLAQAGINKSPVDFRAEQLLWAAAGFAAALAAVDASVLGGADVGARVAAAPEHAPTTNITRTRIAADRLREDIWLLLMLHQMAR
jgi:tight adherence protein C